MSYESQPGPVVGQPTTTSPVYEERQLVKPAKTSAAAVFSLVFGLSALLSVLTVLLGPLGLVLSVIGIILGIVGIRNSRRVGVTGRGTAIGGLVLSIIALLLGAAMALGVTFFLNDQQALDRVEQQIQDWRNDLPADVNLPD